MALDFPNAARALDARRGSISFWGADSLREIAFHVEGEALRKLGAPGEANEDDLLAAFDRNRDAIRKAAKTAYGRNPGGYHRLGAQDV